MNKLRLNSDKTEVMLVNHTLALRRDTLVLDENAQSLKDLICSLEELLDLTLLPDRSAFYYLILLPGAPVVSLCGKEGTLYGDSCFCDSHA